MRTVFADTSFFLALLNPADPAHGVAKDLSRTLKRHRISDFSDPLPGSKGN
jgi:predicted nucleic acid-binding protein